MPYKYLVQYWQPTESYYRTDTGIWRTLRGAYTWQHVLTLVTFYRHMYDQYGPTRLRVVSAD